MLRPERATAEATLAPPHGAPTARPELHVVPADPSPRGEITEAIREYLARTPHDTPVLVMDLDLVAWNYHALAAALPETAIYYAVKANPAPELLDRLATLGCCFDVASRGEIDLCLARGIDASRLSFGNTIKKERDIAHAHRVGVPLFAVDSGEEVEKVARAAPGAHVFCRILTSGAGADWPLSRKFGCTPAMAEQVLLQAETLGLSARGVSFHVGSQQGDLGAWDAALVETAALFDRMTEHGIVMDLVNLGGGFPARYRDEVAATGVYGDAIRAALADRFAGRAIRTIAEPGRGLVGDAGAIRAEVVLVSRKDESDALRWVYLDIGKFSGLAETMDEAIKYRIVTERDGGEDGPVVIAGPSCDSADILYERSAYRLPLGLRAGDTVLVLATGAYTSTYASVGFNGFPPLATVCV